MTNLGGRKVCFIRGWVIGWGFLQRSVHLPNLGGRKVWFIRDGVLALLITPYGAALARTARY